MTQVPNPPPNFTVSDPNNVAETLVSGPINMQIGPEVCLLTFTRVQADINRLMQGLPDSNPKAIVTVKLAFPTSQLQQLHTMVGQGLAAIALHRSGAAIPNGGIVIPGGPVGNA
jgi:hypothetical protein